VVGDVREDLARKGTAKLGQHPSFEEAGQSKGKVTHSSLERSDLVIRKSIRLGDDGDKIDLLVQTAHELDVDRLEPTCPTQTPRSALVRESLG
jgi:hypothetical protein